MRTGPVTFSTEFGRLDKVIDMRGSVPKADTISKIIISDSSRGTVIKYYLESDPNTAVPEYKLRRLDGDFEFHMLPEGERFLKTLVKKINNCYRTTATLDDRGFVIQYEVEICGKDLPEHMREYIVKIARAEGEDDKAFATCIAVELEKQADTFSSDTWFHKNYEYIKDNISVHSACAAARGIDGWLMHIVANYIRSICTSFGVNSFEKYQESKRKPYSRGMED